MDGRMDRKTSFILFFFGTSKDPADIFRQILIDAVTNKHRHNLRSPLKPYVVTLSPDHRRLFVSYVSP